jgi:hypothetical protein
MKKATTVAIVLLLTLGSNARAGGVSGGKPHEHTLDLVAAYALEGMFDEARRVLDPFPDKLKQAPGSEKHGYSPEREQAERIALQWSLVQEMLGPSGKDAFELLTDVVSKTGWGGDAGDPVSTVLWQKLFARYAKREGYGSIGAYVLRRTGDLLDYRLDRERFEEPGQREAAAAQREEVARELARLEETGSARSITPGSPGPTSPAPAGSASPAPAAPTSPGSARSGAAPVPTDPIAPLLRRLLESPRLVTFREVPLPANVKPVPMTEEEEEAQGEKLKQQFSFPEGFAPVRAERQGDEVVAIGVSQDYDSVGEISRGAYWVIRSHDGGKSWSRPLYTGLRIQAPYVVRPASNVPLLAGDRMQVEVMVRELDESSITFPPIGLRAKREQEGLMLEIPFADLERDSDGDGLTDLAEERLVTDPYGPDTDGDGLPDGSDPLPQVAWSSLTDESAGALGAVLERIAGMRSMAIIHEIGGPKNAPDDLMRRAKRATLTDERTSFIEGDRSTFGSLMTTRRVVVLTPAELDLAQKKFGPIFAYRLPLFVLDHAGRRGFVIWDAQWRGGILKLNRTDSAWELEAVSDWIT